MDIAQKIGFVIPFLPHAISIYLVSTAKLPPQQNFRRPPGWVFAGGIVPLLTIPIVILVLRGLDPAWGARSALHRFDRAAQFADQFRLQAEGYSAPFVFRGDVPTFVNLGSDLPRSVALTPHADEIIVGLDLREIPDLGLVLYVPRARRWLYFSRAHVVAFANGRADLVPTAELPQRMANSSRRRAELGLPPAPVTR
jgi:hypothetical protein